MAAVRPATPAAAVAVSVATARVGAMAKAKTLFECEACGQRPAQWAGRCPACGGWGTVVQVPAALAGAVPAPAVVRPLGGSGETDPVRLESGLPGLDRVLGGGLVPGSVVLLAGEPGIGKSTLLLQLAGSVAGGAGPCLLASGEESRDQVSARARRLRVDPAGISFVPGRDLAQVLEATRAAGPSVLIVDSIQAIRDTAVGQIPGGVAQVRGCTDALVGLAKDTGAVVVLAGHVTKDGDLAGPRALEHAVDVVLSFDGDPRSGLRVLAAGKNRFGAEGETSWFEMGAHGLTAIDPTGLLVSGRAVAGAAVALCQRGRRALAVEIQALVGSGDGPGRRHATGLDLRRFQLVAAVLDRAGISVGRAELFGAAAGGVKVDDPACDLAVAAAIASAAAGVAPPEGAAFVGEIALTGQVRPAPAMRQRFHAALAAGCRVVYVPGGPPDGLEGIQIVPVDHVDDALAWALRPAVTRPRSLPA